MIRSLAPPGCHTMNQPFEAIGRYIYFFSHVEGTLRLVIMELLGLSDQQFNRLMPVIDFGAICNVIKATIPEKLHASRAKQANDLISRAQKSNEDRIRVAHGSWAPWGAVHVRDKR